MGWEGAVENVQPQGGGDLVTVSVYPDLDSADLGPATFMPSDYSEIYQVTNGMVQQYVGFNDPDGTSGQFPDYLVGL